MQFEWLKTFVAVVDNGGFNAAAESLNRSQSRVSAHIRCLEREIDVDLFDRSRRPATITYEGEVFLRYARSLLAGLQAGKSDVASVRNLAQGEVRLGAISSVCATFVPDVVSAFSTAFPGISVNLVEAGSDVLVEQLWHSQLDIALLPNVVVSPRSGLESQPLWREPLKLLHHPDHQLSAIKGPIPLETLADTPLIVGRATLELEAALSQAGCHLRSLYETSRSQTLVALVRKGLGVAVTNHLAIQASRRDGVTVRDLAPLNLAREVCLYRSPGPYQPAAARELEECILRTAIPQGTHPVESPEPPGRTSAS